MLVDFGSGYRPYKKYKTCDFNYGCDFYNIKEIPDNSVTLIRCRNVIHHIPDLINLFKEFNRILKKNGRAVIIDCAKDYVKINYILDTIYYKGIAKNNNIWYTSNYRDITKFINGKLKVVKEHKIRTKSWITLKKV